MLTSLVPIFSHLLAISSRMISVAAVVPGGGVNVPSRMAMAASVSAEYPMSSNKAHWRTWVLSALLDLLPILLATPSSTYSLVTHALVVQSLSGTLTLVGLEFLVCLSSRRMEVHAFSCTLFLRISLSLFASLPLPLFHFPSPLGVGTRGIILASTGILS